MIVEVFVLFNSRWYIASCTSNFNIHKNDNCFRYHLSFKITAIKRHFLLSFSLKKETITKAMLIFNLNKEKKLSFSFTAISINNWYNYFNSTKIKYFKPIKPRFKINLRCSNLVFRLPHRLQ